MNRIKQPESGALSSKKSNLVTNLGGAALLALTTGIAKEADAATWDTPVAISAINTTTAHEGYAAPDDAGNLLYGSSADGVTNTTKVLLSGASTPTDVSATGLSSYTEAAFPQPNGSGSFLLYDADSNDILEVVDTSGGSYSSGTVAVAYANADYGFSGAPSYDQNSGEIAFTNWDSPSFDIDYLDGTPIIDTASTDEMTPSLDSSHNRMFYVLDNSGTYEIWVTDLSGATSDEYVVDGLTPYYDQTNNRLYYAAVNGSTYDAYYMDEIVAAADEDGDGEAASTDCDDTNAAINSSATEMCDAVDNDCDGDIDGGAADASTWYIDNDGDGVGGATTQEACDAPEGYVSTGGDYDDNDASVQTEPTPGECEEESADGTYMPTQTICTPEGEWSVGGGSSAYEAEVDIIELDAQGDWGAWVDAVTADTMSYSDRYVLMTGVGSRGRTGNGVSVDAMNLAEEANMAPAAPPSEDGSEYYLTIEVTEGTATLIDMIEETEEELGEGTHTVELDSEGDADTDTDSDTDTDTGIDTGDTDSGTETDTDTDTGGTPDNKDSAGEDSGDRETPKDDGRGGWSCGTPLPDPDLVVLGLAGLTGIGLRRRRK